MGIFAFLNPVIGSALAIKGIEKLDPTMKKFFGYGTAAGYGTDQILDFLRSKAESEGYKGLKSKLSEGEAQGTLRPDERATKERIRRAELPADIAQGALSTAAGVAGGLIGAAIPGKPKNQAEAGEPVVPSTSGHIRSQLEHGPFEQGPEQGMMGPMRQGFEPQYATGPHPQPQHPQHPRGEREKALTRHADMNKKKKLIDQLVSEFEEEYGNQGILESPQVQQQAAQRQRQSRNNSELAAMTVEGLNILKSLRK